MLMQTRQTCNISGYSTNILEGTRYGQDFPTYQIENNMSNYLITVIAVTKHIKREHNKHTQIILFIV